RPRPQQAVAADGSAAPAAGGDAAQAAGAPGQERKGGHRQRNERQQRTERQAKSFGQGKEPQKGGPGGRPGQPGGRKDQRGGRPRRDRGDQVERAEREQYYAKPHGSGSGRRDKAPDPNSPFAKLAALKQQLEGNKE
ncbi:MAG: helicase, partial [Pseudolabrys sp.]|nr:helicase [Pseudolabrys sp.]